MNDGGAEKIRELWRCAMDSRMKDGLSAGRGVVNGFFGGGRVAIRGGAHKNA